MKWLVIVFLFIYNCSFSQLYKTVKYEDIFNITNGQSETLYVLNFWTNWSYESKKELPLLDNLEDEFKGKRIKVILISIDEKEDFDEWVNPFLIEMNLQSEVWWLDEPNIHQKKYRIDRHWKQEVPFTLIVRGSSGERYWKDGGRWHHKHLHEIIKGYLD